VLTNDIVLVVDVGGKEPIVIGRVEAAAPSFEVMRHPVRFWSVADVSGYSDAGTTEKWSVAGATGNAQFDGTVSAGAATFASVNSPVVVGNAATNASPDTSTTDTGVYSVAMTESLTLPAGTWVVQAWGWLGCLHSANNRVLVGIDIDGTVSGAVSPSAPSASPSHRTVATENRVAGLAGSRSIDVKVVFRSTDAGTTSANQPSLLVIAWRTS
jgi:hypothetical protein